MTLVHCTISVRNSCAETELTFVWSQSVGCRLVCQLGDSRLAPSKQRSTLTHRYQKVPKYPKQYHIDTHTYIDTETHTRTHTKTYTHTHARVHIQKVHDTVIWRKLPTSVHDRSFASASPGRGLHEKMTCEISSLLFCCSVCCRR